MIVISPFSRKRRDGKPSAKDYPYWEELLKLLPEPIVQIGEPGERKLVNDFRTYSFPELKEFIKEMDFFISVDNFFPHFCHHYGRHGIVLWGKSDPQIVGYPENMNLLKDRKNLRLDQFMWWHDEPYDSSVFVEPLEVSNIANLLLNVMRNT